MEQFYSACEAYIRLSFQRFRQTIPISKSRCDGHKHFHTQETLWSLCNFSGFLDVIKTVFMHRPREQISHLEAFRDYQFKLFGRTNHPDTFIDMVKVNLVKRRRRFFLPMPGMTPLVLDKSWKIL
jgi:hypothetical protein